MIVRIKTEEIRIKMIKKHMKAQDLAKEAGVNINTIYYLLQNGKSNFSTFAKVCHVIGIKMDDVVEVLK